MTYALSAKQDGIMHFSVGPCNRLSCMEKDLEAVFTCLHFSSHYLLEEVIDFQVVVFFIHHVKADNHLRVRITLTLISLQSLVDSQLDIFLASDLKATYD